jgi:hypothetical protein
LDGCLGVADADFAGHELGEEEVSGFGEGLVLFNV